MTPVPRADPRTVLVCDDSPHLRDALTSLIDDYPQFRVTGQTDNADACLRLLADAPDILILDVRMPGGGADLVRAARAVCPSMRIVMHSGHSDALLQQEMLDAGADVYVIKSGRFSRLVQAMDGPAHVPAETAGGIHDPVHTAHFFPDDSTWSAELVRYARSALAGHGRLMMVATTAHVAAVQAALSDAVALAQEQNRVLIYPAEQTMSRLIPRGTIDKGYFQHELLPAVEEFRVGPGDVSFWGEMVGLTWGAGNVVAAMELEGLWNDWAADGPLSMKCPYPATTSTPVCAADLADVRRAHRQTFGLPSG